MNDLDLSNLRKLRKERNLLQKDLAKYLGITIASYSLYENNKRTPPYSILKKLCKFYNVDIDLLIGLREPDQHHIVYGNPFEDKEQSPMQDKYEQLPQFTDSNSDNNTHKYDAPIRVNHSFSPEDIENLKEINTIYKKIENREKLTENDLQILKDYNQREELAKKRLKEALQTMQEKFKSLIEIQSAYNKLNEAGQEEAIKRIDELTEIQRYTKPDTPPQE